MADETKAQVYTDWKIIDVVIPSLVGTLPGMGLFAPALSVAGEVGRQAGKFVAVPVAQAIAKVPSVAGAVAGGFTAGFFLIGLLLLVLFVFFVLKYKLWLYFI